MREYIRFSQMAREIYEDYTDQIEPFGLDESWLDVTGSVGINGVIQDIFHRGIGPKFGVFAAALFSIVQLPIPAGRKDALTVQRRRDLAVGHAGAAHPVDLLYHSGGFIIHHQPVFVLIALAVSVRSVGGQILAAFLFGIQHRFDFP